MDKFNKRYYAVNGSNAVAVFDSWWQVKYSQKYFKSFRNKRFDTYKEAEAHALSECFLEFHQGRIMPNALECNEIIFFKNCLKALVTFLPKY